MDISNGCVGTTLDVLVRTLFLIEEAASKS